MDEINHLKERIVKRRVQTEIMKREREQKRKRERESKNEIK